MCEENCNTRLVLAIDGLAEEMRKARTATPALVQVINSLDAETSAAAVAAEVARIQKLHGGAA